MPLSDLQYFIFATREQAAPTGELQMISIHVTVSVTFKLHSGTKSTLINSCAM